MHTSHWYLLPSWFAISVDNLLNRRYRNVYETPGSSADPVMVQATRLLLQFHRLTTAVDRAFTAASDDELRAALATEIPLPYLICHFQLLFLRFPVGESYLEIGFHWSSSIILNSHLQAMSSGLLRGGN